MHPRTGQQCSGNRAMAFHSICKWLQGTIQPQGRPIRMEQFSETRWIQTHYGKTCRPPARECTPATGKGSKTRLIEIIDGEHYWQGKKIEKDAKVPMEWMR